MEQEHTKPTSNWQEFWQILRHGQFGKLFAGATENTLIQFFRYCFVGGAATVVDWGISALLFLPYLTSITPFLQTAVPLLPDCLPTTF